MVDVCAIFSGARPGPQLLETYDSERRPVAERTMEQALARLQTWFKDPPRSCRLPWRSSRITTLSLDTDIAKERLFLLKEMRRIKRLRTPY
jgi:hypothetical protein